MDIEETRDIILAYLAANHPFIGAPRHNRRLINGDKHYQIRPDDAFLYEDNILLVEYENNDRPVESISKYYWLFENTKWLEEADLKIKLLLTINTPGINAIRRQTIPILGEKLKKEYPQMFDFCFIDFNELNEENLIFQLENLV